MSDVDCIGYSFNTKQYVNIFLRFLSCVVAVLKIKTTYRQPSGVCVNSQREVEKSRERERDREREGGGGNEGRRKGLKYSATALIVVYNNNNRHLANMYNNNKKETSPLANGFEVSVYTLLTFSLRTRFNRRFSESIAS